MLHLISVTSYCVSYNMVTVHRLIYLIILQQISYSILCFKLLAGALLPQKTEEEDFA